MVHPAAKIIPLRNMKLIPICLASAPKIGDTITLTPAKIPKISPTSDFVAPFSSETASKKDARTLYRFLSQFDSKFRHLFRNDQTKDIFSTLQSQR